MTVTISPPMFLQFFDPNNSGAPAIGFKLFTYIAGTSTKQATWTDSTQTIQNANPLPLDGNGVGNFWGDPTLAYKFVWAPSNDTDPPTSPIRTVDNLYFPLNLTLITQQFIGTLLYPQTAAEIVAGITPTNYAYPAGHVYRYGANTIAGTTDMTTALQNSISAVGSGGIVIWPNDTYLTTAPILAENLRGLTVQCAAGQFGFNGTRIIGKHTGKTILSLVGSLVCTIGPVVLEGSASATPKTGLLLGRASASNAGQHNFYGTTVQGHYSVVGVYNIASESNCWFGVTIEPTAAPFAAIYMAQTDGIIATIGGLTASSMEDQAFFGGTFGNFDTTVGSTGIFIDAGIATGHIHFYKAFLTKNGGDSFIFLRLGQVDGQGTYFPIGFHDCVGEIGSGAPNSGLHVTNATSTDPLPLAGFTATNIRFNSTISDNILCDGVGHIQFQGAVITTPFVASGRQPSVLGNLDFSYVNLQFESSTTVNEATNSTIICGQGSLTLATNTGGNVIQNGSNKYQLPVLTTAPVIGAVASTTAASQLSVGATVATSATAGGNGAPPAQVVGYIICNLGGSTIKIPYYGN